LEGSFPSLSSLTITLATNPHTLHQSVIKKERKKEVRKVDIFKTF